MYKIANNLLKIATPTPEALVHAFNRRMERMALLLEQGTTSAEHAEHGKNLLLRSGLQDERMSGNPVFQRAMEIAADDQAGNAVTARAITALGSDNPNMLKIQNDLKGAYEFADAVQGEERVQRLRSLAPNTSQIMH